MNAELQLPDAIETIPEALAFWADRTPDAPALRSIDGRVVSHRELRDAVARVATRLSNLGITPEDHIAVLLTPAVESWIALLAGMVTAITVPLNPLSAPPELTRDLQRLPVRLVVTSRGAQTLSQEISAKLGIAIEPVENLTHHDQTKQSLALRLPLVAPERIATILHTSGTTGLPKRVPRPHATFVAAARAEAESSGLTAADVLLLATGPHAKAGQANMLGALLSGGSCIVAPHFDPAMAPGWIRDHRPTWIFATATQLNHILDADATDVALGIDGAGPPLRFIRAGSQPMTPGTVERAERRFGAPVLDGYGMSEASCIAASGPTAGDRREGACGRPWATAVRICDDVGKDVSSGSTGEVVVAGPTVFPGYLDDADATVAAFLPGGWFRTGDVGFLDDAGYLHLVGRRGEIINRGGEKIAPVEVDRVLLGHPAVADAAAFAVPDVRLGEDVVCAVVLKPGHHATPRDLRRWLFDRLSPYKVPRRIWIKGGLPRTATGKVQRAELARQWLEEQR